MISSFQPDGLVSLSSIQFETTLPDSLFVFGKCITATENHDRSVEQFLAILIMLSCCHFVLRFGSDLEKKVTRKRDEWLAALGKPLI
jgi:hypothetical protein